MSTYDTKVYKDCHSSDNFEPGKLIKKDKSYFINNLFLVYDVDDDGAMNCGGIYRDVSVIRQIEWAHRGVFLQRSVREADTRVTGKTQLKILSFKKCLNGRIMYALQQLKVRVESTIQTPQPPCGVL